jgi:hypothetical protein
MIFKYQELVFDWIFYLTWILYFTAYFGIIYSDSTHYYLVQLLDVTMQYYISLFLIFRFNPFYKTDFTSFDRKVVFSAGLFLFTTTTLGQYAKINFIKESNKYLDMI